MFAENALRIELHRRGVMQVLEVQADRALVGSGAHCDLRLAPDEAAIEQLTIEARDEEVYASVRALEPACRLNGAPFLEGRLTADSLLELSGVALRVTLTELKQVKATTTRKSSETHPAVQVLGLLAVAGGLYYLLNKPEAAPSVLSSSVNPPALFAGGPEACPQSDVEAARSLAEQELTDADSKAERAPFYPGDGILAVHLYERAAACSERAGNHGEAHEARAAAKLLKQRLTDELHVRHVRLERLLTQQKYVDGARELRMVAEYVEDPGHPYAHWLSAVRRELEIRNDVREGG